LGGTFSTHLFSLVSLQGSSHRGNDGPREFSVGGEKSGLAVMKNENEDKNQDNNSYVKSLFKVSVVENLT